MLGSKMDRIALDGVEAGALRHVRHAVENVPQRLPHRCINA